jgi:hypothetical protein
MPCSGCMGQNLTLNSKHFVILKAVFKPVINKTFIMHPQDGLFRIQFFIKGRTDFVLTTSRSDKPWIGHFRTIMTRKSSFVISACNNVMDTIEFFLVQSTFQFNYHHLYSFRIYLIHSELKIKHKKCIR